MKIANFLEAVKFPDDNGGQPFYSRHTAVDTIMKKMDDAGFAEFCKQLEAMTDELEYRRTLQFDGMKQPIVINIQDFASAPAFVMLNGFRPEEEIKKMFLDILREASCSIQKDVHPITKEPLEGE